MDKVSLQASSGPHGLGVKLLGRSELLRGIYENTNPWGEDGDNWVRGGCTPVNSFTEHQAYWGHVNIVKGVFERDRSRFAIQNSLTIKHRNLKLPVSQPVSGCAV